ncbi:hypothetical protein HYH03_016737 [Edaphochlamys debaryana]|uniref:Uncharacterized protein n=1 Tax=Edaphochlamys debaryana TaxID=47281 RepID=A0A835XGX5_9CHLO|nr:hypothetical protein HYH03_016737 [Edaphochlamys debaryana]|eukprot:KAG2484427.1 hypothetical protein HYH03_016737 [Edaphochlamys debaryana]
MVSITVSAIMVALLLATAALLLHQRDRNRVADEHSGAAVMPPQAAADDLKPKPAPVPIPSPSPPPPVIGAGGRTVAEQAVKAVRHAGADTQRQELLLSMEGQGDAGALLMVDWDRRNADIKVVQRAPPSSPAAAGLCCHCRGLARVRAGYLSYGKMPQIKICRYELAEILQLSLLELTRPPQAAAVAAGPAAKPAALIKAPAALESEEEAPQLQPPEESGSPGPDLTSLEAACSALAGSPGFACDAASRRCFLPVPGTGAALMEPRVLFELSYDTPEDAGVTAAPQPPAASRKMRHEVYAKPQAEIFLRVRPNCDSPLLVLDYDKGGVEFKLAVLASADAEGGAGAAGSSVSYDLIAHVLELDDLSFGAKDGTIEIRTFRTSNPRSLTLVDVLGKPPPADAPTPPPRV